MATEDTMGRLMSECLKINDIVHFDCHIYDKLGTVGSGKDRSVVYPKTLRPNTPPFLFMMTSVSLTQKFDYLFLYAGVIFMQ